MGKTSLWRRLGRQPQLKARAGGRVVITEKQSGYRMLLQPTLSESAFKYCLTCANYIVTRFRKVEEWEPKTREEILDGQEAIYDSELPDERNEVNLDDLDLIDESGHEINIFDINGYRIPRRDPMHDEDQEPCGLLARLPAIRGLFRDIIDDSDDDSSVIDLEQDDELLNVNVYPQAFTRHFGHFQANKVPAPFRPILKELNATLAEENNNAKPVVRGVACQGYNHIQHCLTERAGGLDVVHGEVTAGLAGVITTSLKATRAHRRIMENLRNGLPHARIARKLGRREVLSRAFRLEPVFVVDIQGLEGRYQNGRLANIPIFLDISLM
jgi:hypothetical protein